MFQENGEKKLNIKSSSDVSEKPKQPRTQEPSEVKPHLERIYNFDCFAVMLASFGDDAPWKEHWQIFEQHDGICFYRLSRDEYFSNVIMSFKILVNKDMRVVIFKNESEAASEELNWVLKVSRLENWGQFYRLLEYYSTEPPIQLQSNPIHQIERAIESLDKIWNSESISGLIAPIKEQLSMALLQLNPNHEVTVKVEIEDGPTDTLSLQNIDQNHQEDVQVKAEPPPAETVICTPSELPSSPKPKQKKTYKKKAKLEKATHDTSDQAVVKCEHCDKILLKSALGRHTYNVHSGSGFCDRCGKKFNSRKKLREHLLRHQGIARVKCPHCDDMLQYVSLRRHIKVRHQGYKPFGW